MNIKATKNYSQFNLLSENRSIITSKVRTLRKSILKYGILRPVVIAKYNNKLYIIDGQHLFQALSLMDLAVPYVEVKTTTKREMVELMATLNSTATSWKLTDYVHAWKELGLSDYVRLYSLFVRYNYGISELSTITTSNTDGGASNRAIKSGNYKMQTSDVEAIKIISYIEDILELLPETTRFLMNRVVRGFIQYYRFVEVYDHKYILTKVKDNIECLKLFVEAKDFYDFFTKED